MYCPSCGIEITQELNYCNRCGANLNQPANLVPLAPAKPIRLTGPTIAICTMVVLSLIVIFGMVENLARREVPAVALVWMVAIALALVFGVTGLLVRVWLRLLTDPVLNASQGQAQLKRAQPAPQLPAAKTGPMSVPNSSVTDHTTRTFDPVLKERFEKGK